MKKKLSMKIKFTKYQEVQESGKKSNNFSSFREMLLTVTDNDYSTTTHRLDRAAPISRNMAFNRVSTFFIVVNNEKWHYLLCLDKTQEKNDCLL